MRPSNKLKGGVLVSDITHIDRVYFGDCGDWEHDGDSRDIGSWLAYLDLEWGVGAAMKVDGCDLEAVEEEVVVDLFWGDKRIF